MRPTEKASRAAQRKLLGAIKRNRPGRASLSAKPCGPEGMVRLFAQPGQRSRHHHALPLLLPASRSPILRQVCRKRGTPRTFAARPAVFPFQNASVLLVLSQPKDSNPCSEYL